MEPTATPDILKDEAPKANPFEAALREGAPATYLAMVEAGLHHQFDPLPKQADGAGLCSLALERHLGEMGAKLAAKLIELGADPTADHVTPRGLRRLRHFESSDAGFEPEHAPLASLAIGVGFPCFDLLWKGLSPEQLLKISPSALPWACMSDRKDAIEALLGAGADPDQRDPQGWPSASRCHSAASLKLLLDAGADLRAALPESRWRKGESSPYQALMADTSLAAEPKAMRELAAAWSAMNAEKGKEAGSDLAEAAFKALAFGNADTARRCVEALGESSISRKGIDGDTLLACACRHGNFPLARKLMAFGASPFDITALGESGWGNACKVAHMPDRQLSMYGARKDSKNGKAFTRGDRDKAQSLCHEIETKRKYRPMPWTSKGPASHTLLETLIGRCPPELFFGWAESAKASGADPRQALSTQMDMSCAILLHVAMGSLWIEQTVQKSHSFGFIHSQFKDFGAISSAVVSDFPTTQSSLASKAALYRAALDMIDGAHNLEPIASFGFGYAVPRGLFRPEVADRNEALFAVFRQALLEGAKAQGTLGLPDARRTPDPTRPLARCPEAIHAALGVEYEKGALEASSRASPASFKGPRL